MNAVLNLIRTPKPEPALPPPTAATLADEIARSIASKPEIADVQTRLAEARREQAETWDALRALAPLLVAGKGHESREADNQRRTLQTKLDELGAQIRTLRRERADAMGPLATEFNAAAAPVAAATARKLLEGITMTIDAMGDLQRLAMTGDVLYLAPLDLVTGSSPMLMSPAEFDPQPLARILAQARRLCGETV